LITAAWWWLAALLPGLVAVSVAPSATVFNQAAAWLAWGLLATYGLRLPTHAPAQAAMRSVALLAALALSAAAALVAWRWGHLPAALAWSGAATLGAAAAMAWLGAAVPTTQRLLVAWFSAWLAAGLANALVGVIQVFVPAWADGQWIASSHAGGRALGNLRQPNHLAGLLLWGAVAAPALVALGPLARTGARRAFAVAAFAFIVFAVVLTGSRTGVVGLLALTVWGAGDRRLPRFARGLLLATPLLFAASYGLAAWWAATQVGHDIGVAQRIGQVNVTSGRFLVWHDTLALIAAQPWLGVGFGEYNLAWTLTPVAPERAAEFFDHSHNLPLQLLVELGVPLGLLVLGLLLFALWQAAQRCGGEPDAALAAGRRALVAMLLLTGLHSVLEYPLWYAHFLLPAAFAGGLALGGGAVEAQRRPWPMFVGAALVAGGGLMLWDYQRVSAIFGPADDGRTLEERIARGQRSWFFAHHADYARITSFEDVAPARLAEFRRATHHLLDTRLLIAWARAHEREGQIEKARWIADRLRELRQESAEPFFAPCGDAAVAVKPFQCTPASVRFSWRDFR
jgi:O-antigen ligase